MSTGLLQSLVFSLQFRVAQLMAQVAVLEEASRDSEGSVESDGD